MDRDLYEALEKIAQCQRGSTSMLRPESNDARDRQLFDDLALKVFELRNLGYIEFGEKQYINCTFASPKKSLIFNILFSHDLG